MLNPSVRMFLIDLDRRLRMLFSIILRAQAKNERSQHENDHLLFLGCENEAVAKGG
jgi:hypothetical protein